MHEVQVFSYLGVGTLAFILSGIFIKSVSFLCNRMANLRHTHAAAAAAAAGSAYREVVVETLPRIQVVAAEEGGCCSSSSSDDYNFSDREKKLERLSNCNCIICMCEIENGDVCWDLTVCNHRFHADCIRKWMNKNKNCPLCRAAISVSLH